MNNSPQTQAAIPTSNNQISLNPQPQQSAPQTQTVSKNQRPKIFTLISLLFFIQAILCASASFLMEWVIYTYNEVLTVGPISNDFLLTNFPLVGIVPIMSSLLAIIYIFVALRISKGTRNDYRLGLGSLLLIPLNFLINQAALKDFIAFNLSQSSDSSAKEVFSFVESAELLPTSSTFVLGIVILGLLLTASQKFNANAKQKLTRTNKLLLVIVSLVVLMPLFLIVGNDYRRMLDQDYGYTKAAESVSYHIYRPTYLPGKLKIVSQYMTNEQLADQNNAVRLIMASPIKESLPASNNQMAVITQVGVPTNYSVLEFAKNNLANGNQIRTTDLSIANGGRAYLVSSPLGDTQLNSVVFKTIDDVLIVLISPKVPLETLLEIARGLE